MAGDLSRGARPLPFLDAHFRVGNALLGTTPALLRNTIPDTAFVALGDDDKDWTAKLKARNRDEREANADQLALEYGPETLNVETAQFTKVARDADAGTASTVRMRARADARCAAFVQPKKKAPGSGCATSG